MNINKAKKQAFELFDQQKISEAQKAFVKLCRKDRTDTELWLAAGISEGMLGNVDNAIERFKHILKLEPKHIDALLNLGFAYEQLAEYKESIHYYKSILKFYPDDANSHFRLGIVLDAIGGSRQAIKSYEKALVLKPDFYEVYFNLGVSYLALSSPTKAIEFYKQYQKYHNNSVASMSIGEAYLVLNQSENSLSYFKDAIRLDSNNTKALNYYADLLLKQGQFNDATKIFLDVLAKDPDDVYALIRVLAIKKENDTSKIVDKLESFLKNNVATEKNKTKILFALAEYYDEAMAYEKAFKYFNEANKTIRKGSSYKTEIAEKEFNAIASMFTKEFISERQQLHEFDVKPIFVIGMPRSGTTLVEQILATHTEVEGVGEVNSLNKVMKDYFNADYSTEYYPQKIPELSQDVLLALGREYIVDIKKYTLKNKLCIINKMPHNFMFVGLIKILFPNAKIILCERDPRDVCWSLYKKDFIEKHDYSNSLNELAEYYLLYSKLMTHWKSIFTKSELYVVQYEQLTNNPESEIRSLAQYCELNWQDDMLNFHNSARLVKTASEFQVRQKMYTSSIGAWKPYGEFLEPLSQLLEAD